jgi:hypothetical protein
MLFSLLEVLSAVITTTQTLQNKQNSITILCSSIKSICFVVSCQVNTPYTIPANEFHGAASLKSLVLS